MTLACFVTASDKRKWREIWNTSLKNSFQKFFIILSFNFFKNVFYHKTRQSLVIVNILNLIFLRRDNTDEHVCWALAVMERQVRPRDWHYQIRAITHTHTQTHTHIYVCVYVVVVVCWFVKIQTKCLEWIHKYFRVFWYCWLYRQRKWVYIHKGMHFCK